MRVEGCADEMLVFDLAHVDIGDAKAVRARGTDAALRPALVEVMPSLFDRNGR